MNARQLGLLKKVRSRARIGRYNNHAACTLRYRDTAAALRRLSSLPFTTKAEVLADHLAHPPFGSALTERLDLHALLPDQRH